MTDDILIRRTSEESAATDHSHGAEWGARPAAAPVKAMGANVTIQKNWQELIRPNKLQVSPGTEPKREATVVAEPLERGFGVTLGNALRRILLSSLQGAAVQSVHIDGVLHEFSSIPGVREDVTDIVLNIKDIAIKMQGEGPKRMVVKKQGPGTVTAGDIQTVGDIVVLNPGSRAVHARRGRRDPHGVHGQYRQGLCPDRAQPAGRRSDRFDPRGQPLFARYARSPTRSRTPARARSSTTTS